MLDYKRTNIRTNQAHNLKVVGSNPTPATTTLLHDINRLDQISRPFGGGFFCVFPQVFRKYIFSKIT